MVADALRSTLDSLQLDPSVQKDRHYLITMLRRLGYTEVEIRQALGEMSSHTETETTTVELEYNSEESSADVEDFEPVQPSRQGGFVVQEEPEPEPEYDDWEEVEEVQDFDEVTPYEEPLEEFEEIIEEPVEEFEEVEEPRVRFEELTIPEPVWEEPAPSKRVRLRVIRADSPEEAAELARRDGNAVVHTVPVNVRSQGDELDSWTAPEFDHEHHEGGDWQEDSWEEPASTDAWDAEPVADEEAWDDSWEADEWPEDAADAPTDAWDEPAEAAEPTVEPEPTAGYYQRNDYVLHMRKAKLPSGKSETLYFFAKGLSDSGTPVELPEGYVVREHPGSKLPYIVREDA